MMEDSFFSTKPAPITKKQDEQTTKLVDSSTQTLTPSNETDGRNNGRSTHGLKPVTRKPNTLANRPKGTNSKESRGSTKGQRGSKPIMKDSQTNRSTTITANVGAMLAGFLILYRIL